MHCPILYFKTNHPNYPPNPYINQIPSLDLQTGLLGFKDQLKCLILQNMSSFFQQNKNFGTQYLLSISTHTHNLACQSESCHAGLNTWTRQSAKFISSLLSIIEEVWEKAFKMQAMLVTRKALSRSTSFQKQRDREDAEPPLI